MGIHSQLLKLMAFLDLYETLCIFAALFTRQHKEKAISFCCVGCVRPLAVIKATKRCQYSRGKHSFDLAHYRKQCKCTFLICCFVLLRVPLRKFPTGFLPYLYIPQYPFRNEAADKEALTPDPKGK